MQCEGAVPSGLSNTESLELSSDDSDLLNPSDVQNLDEVDNISQCSSDSSILLSGQSDSEGNVSQCSSDSDCAISDEIFRRDLLYDNSSVSVDEAVVKLLDVYVKNRLTKTALSDILKFLHSILPSHNLMPKNSTEFF